MFISKIKAFIGVLLRSIVLVYAWTVFVPAALVLVVTAAPLALMGGAGIKDILDYIRNIGVFEFFDYDRIKIFIVKGKA